ncbi:MAG: transglutaminase family protein [Gammaproteobacteria bacterium]
MDSELPLSAEFSAFAEHPHDPIAGAVLVARSMGAAVDSAWIDAELERHATAAGGAVDAARVVEYLAAEGFRGAETYYHPENSSIEHVLKTHRGIPITLALVVMGVAGKAGLSARGINFPQHFLVRVDQQLIDPFAMTIIDEKDLNQQLAAQNISASKALPEAGGVEIVLRMLNNLRMLAVQRGDHAGALDLSGYQLLMSSERLPLHVERADLWLAAGVPEMARLELDAAIALAPDDTLKAALRARRAALAHSPDRLN